MSTQALGFPHRQHRRILGLHGQGQRPDTEDEEGVRRSVVAREGKACAGLVGRDTVYADEAVDFGYLVGDEVMATEKPWSVPDCSLII